MSVNQSCCMPRPEYPRPQMVRDSWMNLNGCWDFEINHGKSGKERKLYEAEKLAANIVVPFCPESELSGVEYKDFMASVWYKREFQIPKKLKLLRKGIRKTVWWK